jgi:hypothetical protein
MKKQGLIAAVRAALAASMPNWLIAPHKRNVQAFNAQDDRRHIRAPKSEEDFDKLIKAREKRERKAKKNNCPILKR